jgi:hypothetical protein
MKVKPFLALLPCAVFGLWSLGARAETSVPPAEPRFFERLWQWDKQRFYQVQLENVRGRVVFRHWDQPGVLVQASLRATHALGTEELRLFQGAEFKAQEESSGVVSLRASFPGVSSNHPAVVAAATPHLEMDWRLTLPASSVLTVRQEVGGIVGHGVSGRLDLRSRDGEIHLSEIAGWLEASNERGDITLTRVAGDAEIRSLRGRLLCSGQTGDLRVLNSHGDIFVSVSPRWVGEVSFTTVSGNIRTDLSTRNTDLQPGDRGYEGIMQGPLAASEASPTSRIRVDTLHGGLTVATEKHAPE